jgi:acetyl-CoA synthetase
MIGGAMSAKHVWNPTPDVIERANVTRFMRRHVIADHRELVARSIADIRWFWNAVIDDLDIAFFRPHDQILDASRGIAWSRWFVGGSVNLAHQCLDRHASSPRRDHPAVIWEGEDGSVRQYTYDELHAETCRLAGALRRTGIDRGDRVGLFLPMVPEAVVAFLACAKIGAVVIPVFSGFGAEAVAARLDDGNAVALITVDVSSRRGKAIALKSVACEAAGACPSVRHVIVARSRGNTENGPDARHLNWEALVAKEPAECPSEPLDPEAPLMIMYTSGTTGRPKGAVHVHGGFLVKIAQEVAHQADMQPDDVLMWVTDLGWIMGPWELVGGLAAGGTVVLMEGVPDYPQPDRLWSMIERHGITILGVSPTLTRALIKHGLDPVRSHDLGRLRILASTGEPWDPESWRWLFENVGGGRLPIINITGGTEVGACLLSAFPTTPIKPCSLVGPSLGIAVDVYDGHGRSLGPGQGVGELVCTKPWPAMTRGIWGDPERYLATYWSRWPDVWVHGDWASIDEDGDWFLHGRSDDTIKVAGKRLGPAEVESILNGHEAVSESAAVGVPHSLKGEVIVAFVVTRPGCRHEDALRSELCERVAEALGKSFTPEAVRFVAELPKTRSGKILRRVIQRVATGQEPGDLSTIENPAAIDAVRRAD